MYWVGKTVTSSVQGLPFMDWVALLAAGAIATNKLHMALPGHAADGDHADMLTLLNRLSIASERASVVKGRRSPQASLWSAEKRLRRWLSIWLESRTINEATAASLLAGGAR